MGNQTLLLPLLFCLIGALVAALLGHPALNRRVTITSLCWLVALAPLAAFLAIAANLTAIAGGNYLLFEVTWLPSLGINASLYLDSLSALFGLLVSGIGVLVVIYTGYYFKGDPTAWRFLTLTMLFMFSMLGLVLAGDVITLFLFWEGTSVTSYLLVGYKYKDEAARRGAFKALLITAGGGIALLAGLVMISVISGSGDFVILLNNDDLLQSHPLYLAMLGLIAAGAFTKSAQVPFHVWLPDAMTAPTPASAYLHSATMVKAGIYLMARFNPALGNTEAWFWLLSTFGLVTMLTGAYLGLKQNDLKALLAYSTISQLGALMMLIGQDTAEAFKALVVGTLAHALYKCALFLVAGIVDHETGTRDLRRLGGIARAMPMTVIVATLAGFSMAGLPPLFGFLAKETLLVTAVHPSAPSVARILFPASVVIAGAFLLAQSAMLVWDTFFGNRRDASLRAHEPPLGMLLAPAIPAILSLAIVLLPEQAILITLLSDAAANARGAPVNVSLALWHGVNLPLILSLVAIAIGIGLFVARQRVRALQGRTRESFTANFLYLRTLGLIDWGAKRVTRTQNGNLRLYLITMMAGMAVLIIYFEAWPAWPASFGQWPALSLDRQNVFMVVHLVTLLVAVVTAAFSVFLANDMPAILALGISGLAVAILMVLEPAPDIGLVQVVVDLLAVVILVLALTRLPQDQRRRADEFIWRLDWILARDALLSLGAGIVMMIAAWHALTSRPRPTLITPEYTAAAEALGIDDIVGAILIDFRAFDTLFEVVVFAVAGMGVYMLLHFATRTAGDLDPMQGEAPADFRGPPNMPPEATTMRGVGGLIPSPLLEILAYISLPLAMMLGLTHLLYGHAQPGDGFTAGVITSLAIGFWYVVFGYERTKERLGWLVPTWLIGGALLLVLFSGIVAAVQVDGSFLAPVDFGAPISFWLPAGVHLDSALLFELAIGLAILGSVMLVLDSVGRPLDHEPEVYTQWSQFDELRQRGDISLPETEAARREE